MYHTTLRVLSFLGIFCWLASFSFAQESAAREDVRARYPDCHYFIQTAHPNLIQFNFAQNGRACCAIYSLKGNWMGTITRIEPKKLPTAVREEIRKLSDHPIKACYQITNCFTYRPVYTSFVETNERAQELTHFPPFAVAGITVWVSSQETHQGFLVDREGVEYLNLSDSHFIGLLHHGSGRGLASQEVEELLEAFLIPFPRRIDPNGILSSAYQWRPGRLVSKCRLEVGFPRATIACSDFPYPALLPGKIIRQWRWLDKS